MDARNALVTGLPRGGTTLTCELLNQVPDTVALDEPMRGYQLTGRPRPSKVRRVLGGLGLALRHRAPGSAADAVARIDRFLAEQRASLLASGSAISKHVDGQVLGSKIADDNGAGGLRRKLARRGRIQVDGDLTADFLLVIKHNSAFTALLDGLAEELPVYALVRNPLAVLASWQTVPFPVQDGHLPVGEALDAELATQLARTADRVQRQLVLLDWYFGRYRRALPPTAVIRYEDLVADPGRALSVVAPAAAGLAVTLENRNRPRVDADTLGALAGSLLAIDGPSWAFYGRDEVEALAEAAHQGER